MSRNSKLQKHEQSTISIFENKNVYAALENLERYTPNWDETSIWEVEYQIDRLKLMKYLDISRDNDRHDTMRAFYLYVNDLNPQNNPEKKYHCLHLELRK